MGQSYSCFAIKQKSDQLTSNLSPAPSNICTSDDSSDSSQSPHMQSTKRTKVTISQACNGQINSKPNYKCCIQCSDPINFDPNERIRNSNSPGHATSNSHARVHEPQPTQDLNSMSQKSHSLDCHITQICKYTTEDNNDSGSDAHSLLSPSPSKTSYMGLTTDAIANINMIAKNDNEINSNIPGGTSMPSHRKRVRFFKPIMTSAIEKEEINTKPIPVSDPSNGDIKTSTLLLKTRKSKKFNIRKILTSKRNKLKSEEKMAGNVSKMPLIQPHPVTLKLGPNHHMQFFYEKRKKIHRMVKGRGKRKHGVFNKPPKSRAALILRDLGLPKVTRTKTKIVIKEQAEVIKCMEERMAETGFKTDCYECVVARGKQIFTTRYFESEVAPGINTEMLGANPTEPDLILDPISTNSPLEEAAMETIMDHVGEQIEAGPKSAPSIPNATDKFQACTQASNNEKLELNKTAEGARIRTPGARVCRTLDYESPQIHSDEENQKVDNYCQWYISNYATSTKQPIGEDKDTECVTGKKVLSVAIPQGIAHFLYLDRAVLNTYVKPVKEISCIDRKNQIYVCDIGLTSSQCDLIVNVSEFCSSGAYSSYTYAKQTIGCREHDAIAAVCEWPVMRACTTIQTSLESRSDNDDGVNNEVFPRDLVLGEKEPHVVKYDISRVEHQKLNMHTDKSEWTFLIALSEGEGCDYEGGGTYFESINATVHLQKGHALFFPGRLRHRGQKIIAGTRFLLVGFLVENRFDIPFLFD